MSAHASRRSWTGGQYSLYRLVLGGYLLVHFGQLLPWAAELFAAGGAIADGDASPLLRLFPNLLMLTDPPWLVEGMVLCGAAAALCLALGFRDRWAAGICLYVLACLFGRNPLILNPSLPFIGWLLLAHICIPGRPFGSLDARGRGDPGGGWVMPAGLPRVAWIVMAVGYSYSGFYKLGSPSWLDGQALAMVLDNPLARPGWCREFVGGLPDPLLQVMTWSVLVLELLFAPLALLRSLRPWLWLGMLGMHLGILCLIDFADLTAAMLVVQLFTFDPAWVPGQSRQEDCVLYFDSDCGLCHAWVRLLMAEDPDDQCLRLRPLRELPAELEVPPGTLVLQRADGALWIRSAAVFYLLRRLGGLWRILAGARILLPRVAWDLGYRGIARIRRRLLPQPAAHCPLSPAFAQRRG